MRSRPVKKKLHSLLLTLLILFMAACTGKSRTIGTFIEDQAITLNAKRVINTNKETYQGSAVKVLSYNEVLLLTGTASTETARLKILKDTILIPKIRQIHNEITVSRKPSFFSALGDKYLAIKVRIRLLADASIKSSEIKIVCSGGTVYLMGIVNDTEKELVSSMVRKTTGVNRVITMFEIKSVDAQEDKPTSQSLD